MPKTLPRWLLFSSALLSVAACQEIPSTVPSQERATQATEDPYNLSKVVLREYLEARLSGNWARSYELVVTDQTQKSYVKDSQDQAPLAEILGPASTFQILDLTVNRNTVVATALIQMPDLTPFIQKLMMMGVKAEMLGKPAAYGPVMEELVHSLESRQFELVEQTQRFTLIKVKGKWRVDLMSAATNRQ